MESINFFLTSNDCLAEYRIFTDFSLYFEVIPLPLASVVTTEKSGVIPIIIPLLAISFFTNFKLFCLL